MAIVSNKHREILFSNVVAYLFSEMRVRSDSNQVVRDQYTMNHCTVTIIQCSHAEKFEGMLDSLSSADSDRIFCYDKYKDREYYKMAHADHRQSKMAYVHMFVDPRQRYWANETHRTDQLERDGAPRIPQLSDFR